MSFFISKEIENLIDKDSVLGKKTSSTKSIISLKFEEYEHEYVINSFKKTKNYIDISMFLEKEIIKSIIENITLKKIFFIKIQDLDYQECSDYSLRKIKYIEKRNKYLINVRSRIKGKKDV